MNLVKTFATILTLAGMGLLIFACLGVMKIVDLPTSQWGALAPFVLGIIFFFGGLTLFRYLLPGNRN